MSIPTAIQNAVNEQIKNELQAHYTYLGMAAHFEKTAFKGFASWMMAQSREEYGHSMKLYNYLVERDGDVKLSALTEPPTSYGSRPVEIFQTAYRQEQEVTRQINALYEQALNAKDYQTLQFLTWFLNEQVEEENTVRTIVERLEFAGDDPAGLLRLDVEAARQAVAPARASGEQRP